MRNLIASGLKRGLLLKTPFGFHESRYKGNGVGHRRMLSMPRPMTEGGAVRHKKHLGVLSHSQSMPNMKKLQISEKKQIKPLKFRI